jgi:hypothetical protein
MNLGEPIGNSLVATQSNYTTYYPNIFYNGPNFTNGSIQATGIRQIHAALLGDPTLKMFNNSVPSPKNLQLTQVANYDVKIDWTAPDETETYLYAIYRVGNDGITKLITSKPISALTFTDQLGKQDKPTYYVKALKLGSTRSGTFYYSSNPIFGTIDVVGVEEEMKSYSKLFPSPASEKVTIEFTAESGNSSIEITDLEGKLVNKFTFESTIGLKNQLIWNLDSYTGARVASGVYFVKIISGTKLNVEKVIVQ